MYWDYCKGDPTTWDANYGKCNTYHFTGDNYVYCDTDSHQGLVASEVCVECGKCIGSNLYNHHKHLFSCIGSENEKKR